MNLATFLFYFFRSCTDIICCLLFLICIAAMVVISAVGMYMY